MRSWVLRIRKQDKPIFERIKRGEKTIETRALANSSTNKAYYGNITTGDKIVFLCDGEKLEKEVSDVRKYADFDEYLAKEDLENILGKGTTVEKAREIHFSFPGYEERLKEFGIVAFDLK